ncbi:glycoside hydrolase family 3 C-terminal domain-containing protein [Xylanibacter oryzae]|uniref:glycoside hydrolase family 3 C-terminal domain-containing protein n=1 Tax=Xylanibacter oryzae TaxID=185293 RepID=UPI0004B542EE|nr:glycoside hydrolase family 3 C-terminal domain-containing protein [Xylanibacter oryzae]
MFKTLIITFLAIPTLVCAQQPQLGKDPIEKVINAMTLDEKLDLLIGSGGNVKTEASATIGNSSALVQGAAGQLNAIPRLGIPNTVLADGPAGLRIQPKRNGTDKTFYCTHFPIETVMSSTWNSNLVRAVGAAIGDEVKHYGVDVLLAPATNIQRNPLNGRNFEYYSEDPLLAGKITAAMIDGVQSNGVGTSLKHFALNNQETNRTNNNVIGNPRTFREIYLKPFEIAVKESHPWTVMTSYNKINGTYTSERADLLTEILRHEWGFNGMVMTDWYGGQHTTMQMEAGNDLIMPGKLSQREELRKAILNGNISMEIIDRNIKNILEYIIKTPRFNGYVADNNPDLDAHAQVTRNAAIEGMVLLKDDNKALPFTSNIKKLAAFGFTSYDFIAGGTGSGDVNHAYVVSLIDGLKNGGFSIDSSIKDSYEKYIPGAKAKMPKPQGQFAAFLPKKLIPEMELSNSELINAAKNNDAAVITIGKTSGEFGDRSIKTNFNLTDAEKKMINDVTTVFHKEGKKVIVILNVCGVIETRSWISKPDAVLISWLPGQEGGNSVADILAGKESPSGRLPMTWPVSYNDVPSKNDFPNPDEISDDDLTNSLKGFSEIRTQGSRKNFDITTYNDGIYVGYRYYTTKNVPVSFPFGYGLSYTSFEYGKPIVNKDNNGNINITVNVKNKGKMAGKEVVQVYVSAPGKDMDKPARELKGFAKTKRLAVGESETVTINIPYESLASFNDQSNCWQVESGIYKVMVAKNAADMKPLTTTVYEEGKITQNVRPCLVAEQK